MDPALTAALKEENKQSEGWWYLSFADQSGFIGAAITRGRGAVTARLTLLSYGVNPGGEVLALSLSADDRPAPRFWNRLLTRAEVDECWANTGGGVEIGA